MEHVMNDLYDNAVRGIFIRSINVEDLDYIFNTVELKPPTYIFNTAEGAPPFYLLNNSESFINDEFIVYVPNSVTFTDDKISVTVNTYKLAGKRFKIIRY
jgi:hypothetical protein